MPTTHRPFARLRKRSRPTPLPPPPRPSVFFAPPPPPNYKPNLYPSPTKSVPAALADALLRDAVRFVALTGPPSCGKSVSLRALAYDPEIHRVYRDAVVLFHVNHARELDLFREIVAIVGRVCGIAAESRILSEVQGQGIGESAWDMLANSLLGRRVLLIFDGVGRNKRGIDAVLALKRAVERDGGGIGVVSACRSQLVAQCVAERGAVVSVPPLEYGSSKILIGFKEGEDVSDEIKTVLQECSGVPLALAVAAGAVKRLGGEESDWKKYKDYICEKFEQFGSVSGLFRALENCVKEMGEEEVWCGGLKAVEALTAIGADGRRVAFGFGELGQRWGVGETEVEKIVEVLQRFWLVEKRVEEEDPQVFALTRITAGYFSHLHEQKKMRATDGQRGGSKRKVMSVKKSIAK